MSNAGRSVRERKKLADALSSAGMNARRVAVEVLYLMPEDFIAQYETLFFATYSTGEEGRGGLADRDAEVGKARGKAKRERTIETKLGPEWGSRDSSGKGSRRSSVFPVKSEEMMEQKLWVDRQLRKLGRQIKTGEKGLAGAAGVGRVRCGLRTNSNVSVKDKEGKGCGKWLEKEWRFCPSCGRQTSELREKKDRE